MIKLKVLKTISYSKFNEIIKIERSNVSNNKNGIIYAGDIICVKDKSEAEYLCGNNTYKLIACEIISEESPVTETATAVKPNTEKAVKKANVRAKKVLQK